MSNSESEDQLTLRIGQERLVIQRRCEVISITNDFVIALWFLVGSILFLFPQFEHAAIWLFILGSFQFPIRPSIRLVRHIHLRKEPRDGWDC